MVQGADRPRPAAAAALRTSLCDHAIHDPGSTLVIDDLAAKPGSPRAALRIGGRPPRFYAGVPLLSPDGHALGAVCVMDVRAAPAGRAPQLRRRWNCSRGRPSTCSSCAATRCEQRELLSERESVRADALETSRAGPAAPPRAAAAERQRDELTGLLNRSALVAAARRPRGDAEAAAGACTALVLLDVDQLQAGQRPPRPPARRPRAARGRRRGQRVESAGRPGGALRRRGIPDRAARHARWPKRGRGRAAHPRCAWPRRACRFR